MGSLAWPQQPASGRANVEDSPLFNPQAQLALDYGYAEPALVGGTGDEQTTVMVDTAAALLKHWHDHYGADPALVNRAAAALQQRQLDARPAALTHAGGWPDQLVQALGLVSSVAGGHPSAEELAVSYLGTLLRSYGTSVAHDRALLADAAPGSRAHTALVVRLSEKAVVESFVA